MEWENLITLIVGLLVVIGLPLAMRSRKKGGQGKVEEVCQHLQGIGVKASIGEKDAGQGKNKGTPSWIKQSVGTINVTGKNIDSINVIGVANQYGVSYYFDFVVRGSSLGGEPNKKKIGMIRKKNSLLWGKVIDVIWQGDDCLSQKLNLDYRLKEKLLQSGPDSFKGGITIFIDPKYEYNRIRTGYFLPTSNLFETVEAIAKHIKSGW